MKRLTVSLGQLWPTSGDCCPKRPPLFQDGLFIREPLDQPLAPVKDISGLTFDPPKPSRR